MKKNTGLLTLAIFAFIPILLWLVVPTPLPRFSTLGGVIVSLGQVSSLVAIVLFSLNFVISTRLEFINKLFHGLNNAYIKHDQIGQIALVLALLHPLLLLPKYSDSLSSAASFFWLSSNQPYNYGIIALWGMVILVVLTLYLRPKYEIWKFIHKFFGLAFLFASLHVWLITSDVSSFLPLRIYMLSITTTGLVAYLYKSIFGSFLIPKYHYVVSEIKEIHGAVLEITMTPKSESDKINFVAGQFVFVKFLSENVTNEEHPFSIVSSPTEQAVTLAIKKLGDYTSILNKLEIGAKAVIEGPFGAFNSYNPKNQKQLWIAGGIGITPFLSMLSEASGKQNSQLNIDLYYCVKNQNEAVYLEKILQLANMSVTTKFKIIPFYSEEHGHISADVLRLNSGDLSTADIFICAPPAMIHSLKENLNAANIPASNIHSEEFNL
ncbi:ferredoxin reductase family protein [Candidatus Woesebacteria bacterium]|nr:ferredoxin reductase family protein [Candidatus Woesebacteria bacterium]